MILASTSLRNLLSATKRPMPGDVPRNDSARFQHCSRPLDVMHNSVFRRCQRHHHLHHFDFGVRLVWKGREILLAHETDTVSGEHYTYGDNNRKLCETENTNSSISPDLTADLLRLKAFLRAISTTSPHLLALTRAPSATRKFNSLPADGARNTVGSFSFSKTEVWLFIVMRYLKTSFLVNRKWGLIICFHYCCNANMLLSRELELLSANGNVMCREVSITV